MMTNLVCRNMRQSAGAHFAERDATGHGDATTNIKLLLCRTDCRPTCLKYVAV